MKEETCGQEEGERIRFKSSYQEAHEGSSHSEHFWWQ